MSGASAVVCGADQLVAQEQVLEDEVPVAAERGRDDPEQEHEQVEHARMHDRSRRRAREVLPSHRGPERIKKLRAAMAPIDLTLDELPSDDGEGD